MKSLDDGLFLCTQIVQASVHVTIPLLSSVPRLAYLNGPERHECANKRIEHESGGPSRCAHITPCLTATAMPSIMTATTSPIAR